MNPVDAKFAVCIKYIIDFKKKQPKYKVEVRLSKHWNIFTKGLSKLDAEGFVIKKVHNTAPTTNSFTVIL